MPPLFADRQVRVGLQVVHWHVALARAIAPYSDDPPLAGELHFGTVLARLEEIDGVVLVIADNRPRRV